MAGEYPLGVVVDDPKRGGGSPSSKSPLTIRFVVWRWAHGNLLDSQSIHIEDALGPHQSNRHDGVARAGWDRDSLDHASPVACRRYGSTARACPGERCRSESPKKSINKAGSSPARSPYWIWSSLIQIPRTMASVLRPSMPKARLSRAGRPRCPHANRTKWGPTLPPLASQIASRALYQPSGMPSLLVSCLQVIGGGGPGRSISGSWSWREPEESTRRGRAERTRHFSSVGAPGLGRVAPRCAGAGPDFDPGRRTERESARPSPSEPCRSWAQTAWA